MPFPENSFDLVWNFSALWFVDNLSDFLKQITTISRKAIFISVPNQTGLGFISQKYLDSNSLSEVNSHNIDPKNIIRLMKSLSWNLLHYDYIDCPPWPDIGMPKEKFLKLFKLDFLLRKREKKPVSIYDYYSGNNPEFDKQMLTYFPFEKNLPSIIKSF